MRLVGVSLMFGVLAAAAHVNALVQSRADGDTLAAPALRAYGQGAGYGRHVKITR